MFDGFIVFYFLAIELFFLDLGTPVSDAALGTLSLVVEEVGSRGLVVVGTPLTLLDPLLFLLPITLLSLIPATSLSLRGF